MRPCRASVAFAQGHGSARKLRGHMQTSRSSAAHNCFVDNMSRASCRTSSGSSSKHNLPLRRAGCKQGRPNCRQTNSNHSQSDCTPHTPTSKTPRHMFDTKSTNIRILADFGQTQAKLVQLCSTSVQSWPNLVEFGRSWPEFARALPNLPDFDQNMVELGPTLVELAPILVKLGPHWAELGQICPNLVKRWPDLADIEDIRPEASLGEFGQRLARCWPTSGQHSSARLAKTRATIGSSLQLKLAWSAWRGKTPHFQVCVLPRRICKGRAGRQGAGLCKLGQGDCCGQDS